MISYLLTSILLSGIGWAFYRLFLQKRGALRQRRSFLQIMVLSSLAIPLFLPSKPVPTEHEIKTHRQAAFGLRLDQQAVEQYCKCQNPDYGHRISYRTNAMYNLILGLSPALVKLSYGLLILVLIRLFIQVGFLFRLRQKARQEVRYVGAWKLTILHPHRKMAVGAFWLGRPYLIWEDTLDMQRAEERAAILAHELAHLRLGHPLEKAALKFVQCVWLLNPFFYLVQPELERLAEFQADEAGASSLGNRKAYAHLLLNFKRQTSVALAKHFGESQLKKRIKRLVAPPVQQPIRWSGILLLPLLGLQIGVAHPVHQRIDQQLQNWKGYQKAQPHLSESRPQVIYCQDCETVCTPEELSESE